LKICYSNSGVKEPTERDCTKIFLNPNGKEKLAAAPGCEDYDQEYLYFGFYSLIGCVISINVTFQDDERGVRRIV